MRGVMRNIFTLAMLCLLASVSAGCADEESKDLESYTPKEPKDLELYTPTPGTPEAVAYDSGLTRYLGAATPIVKERQDFTLYEFDAADGPVCMRGAPFRSMIRKAEGSNDLVIFLQGGGACWDDFCLAVINTPRKFPSKVNILNKDLEENPVKDWNVSYVPYCDGSLFIGDNTVQDAKGKDRIYAGLHNLSAALSVTKQEFPTPDRILFAGSSAGGFATIMTTPIVRYLWPDTPIYVLADSAAGVAKDGDPSFINMLVDTFGAADLIPKDCDNCIADGNITGFIDYYLPKDDNIKVGLYTSWYDGIISETFLQIAPQDFQESLERITGDLHAKFPQQYRRFITNDRVHTALLGDFTGIIGDDITSGFEASSRLDFGAIAIGHLKDTVVDDVHLADWIRHMINDEDELWQERIAPADYEAVFGEAP